MSRINSVSPLFRPVLMVGPTQGPNISGQSISFTHSTTASISKHILNSAFDYPHQLVTFLPKLILLTLFTTQSIYFTSSRSLKGFFSRDIFIFIVAFILNKRLINHLHGSDFKSFRDNSPRLIRNLIDISYKTISCSIAPSSKMLEHYSIYPTMTKCVIPNCFDSSLLTIDPSLKDFNKPTILYLSNFIYSKGLLPLLQAVVELNQQGAHMDIHLAGQALSDKYMSSAELQRHLSPYRCYDYIHFYPIIKCQKKIQLLQQSTLTILPTFYESEAFPITLVESLLSGHYIISTDHGSIPELLHSSHHSLVAPQVPNIKVAIMAYLSRPDKPSIALDNHNLAMNKYSYSSYVASLTQILAESST